MKFSFPGKSGYMPVNEDEVAKSNDLEPEGSSFMESPSFNRPLRQSQSKLPSHLIALNIILFLLSGSMMIFSVILHQQRDSISPYKTHRNPLLKKTSFYSPLLDRIDIPLIQSTVNNTLYAPSIFRAPPSPEVDAAWNELTSITLTMVSKEDIVSLGKDPNLAVHIPYDENQYPVITSGSHQLHCLNSMRQNLYRDYYFPDGFGDLHEDHLLHCVAMLLQSLTCKADVDLITYNWMEIQHDPVPDFSVNMVCRDFQKVQEWKKREALDPLETVGKWRRQGGETEIKAPAKWWDIWRQQHPGAEWVDGHIVEPEI